MVAAGILQEDERFELIGGEMVPMSPKGIRHERIKVLLNLALATRRPPGFFFAQETTLRVSEDTFVEPDFTFFIARDGLENLNGATALLCIEVADTSLGYDLGRKPAIYARHGVRELWVIDAIRFVTHVHRRPGPDGYAEVVEHPASATLTPIAVPGLAVSLAELDIAD